MEAYEESQPLTMIFVSRSLGSSSSKILYMVSHVEVPPSLLHVVSKNRGVIYDFSDATAFPFFTIAPEDLFRGLFLKVKKNNNYRIYRDNNECEME